MTKTRRIKGSEIPHLVDRKFYNMYFDPEEVEEMQAEYETEYSPEQINQFKKNWKELTQKLKGSEVYSVNKDWNEELVSIIWEKSEIEKKAISIRLSKSDIVWVKKIAESEWMPYQTLISSIIHKLATGKIKINVVSE